MDSAWAFYRRSTDKQELSLEDQRRECRAFAAARGWQIHREFEPSKGFATGLTIDRDPTFQEMVRLAERRDHGIRYLVVYDVSRFGRLPQEDKIYWERRLKKQGGIDVVYVHEDFKNDGSIGDTILKIVRHSEAHQFSIKLSEVTLRGAKSHSALGHSAGGAAPFGYDRLEIDPEGHAVRVMNRSSDWKSNKLHRVIWTPSAVNAPIVRRVFETYDRGTGLNLIVQQLNQERVPAPRGRFWSKTMVHYMLRNRAYVGDRLYNRRSYKAYRRGEKSNLANPPESWIVKEKAHKAIIDRDLFERIQHRLKTRVITIGRTFQRPYLLTGIANCTNCGYRMIGHPLTGNGHRYLTYTCSGYMRIGRSVCRSVHVLADALEREVVRSIRERLAQPSWMVEMRKTLEWMVGREFGEESKSRVEEMKRQLDAVSRQITNIVAAIRTSGRFSEAMNQALADLEIQRESLRGRLRETEERAKRRIGAATLADRVVEHFRDFDRLLNRGLTIEERKELIRCYVHQIGVTHSPSAVHADIWLYKVPIPTTQMTPALGGLEPLIARVNCGGRSLTLARIPPPSLETLIEVKRLALKQPYMHYRASVSGSA